MAICDDFCQYLFLFICSPIISVDSADSECDSGQEDGAKRLVLVATHFLYYQCEYLCIDCSEDSSDEDFQTAFEKPTCVKK